MIASACPVLTHIYCFGADAPAHDVDEKVLGGKGHSLAQMSKAGLPVPPGFTLSTECCRIYNAEKRWADGLEEELQQALAWLEKSTGFSFGKSPRPLLVAVRSGAAVSMPGMMDTVLNCGLHPGLEDHVPRFWETYRDFIKHYGEIVSGLNEHVFEKAMQSSGDAKTQALKCLESYKAAAKREFPTDPYVMMKEAVNAVFESWNSERAARYRAKNNVRNLVGTAVNVQSMCPSELSGVLFTQDPNDPAADKIIIEGTTGLGEALVLGRVEPDLFVVDRKTYAVKEKRISESHDAGIDGHLTEKQVDDLAKLGMKVEEYFNFPVDIEWGWANGKFSLLQSRKIRGLDVALDVPLAREDEIKRLKAMAGDTQKAWAMHNLGETLSFPTPLTWDIVGHFMNRGGFVNLYRDLGFTPSARVQQEGFLHLVAGRIYADVNCSAELFFDTFPLEYDLETISPEQLLGPPTKFNYERAGAAFLFKLPLYLLKMLKSSKLMKRLSKTCLHDFEKITLPKFLDYAQNARDKNLGAMNDAELIKELDQRERVALNDFGRETLKPGFLASYFHDRLLKDFEQIFGPELGQELMSKMLRGLDGDRTVESNIALFRVAHGDLSIERYLSEFGHRAVNEFEFSEKRYKEDHSYLLTIINNYKRVAAEDAAPGSKTKGESASPGELHEKQKHERLAVEDSLGKLLAEHGASSLERDLREELIGAQRYLPYRETGKHYFMMAVALVREVLEEFAERYDLGKDLYFLHRKELSELATRKEELKKEISRRKTRWASLQRLDVPEVLRSSNLDALGRHEEAAAAKDGVLAGLGVAAGVGIGTARLVKSPTEAGDLGAGYVLVCPTTDPSWAPLFVHAKGLVVERGGMLSHGAIVARDFGIPAVVMKNASRMIPDGATIKVDGSKGRVEVMSKPG